MQAEEITIHNFRSIADATIRVSDYGLLIGPNNAGKSNIVDALRIFYEKERYDKNRDFPRFTTSDKESWIDVEFVLNEEEYGNLKDEYRRPGNTVKVRKYLQTDEKGEDGKPKQGIYGYIQDTISNTHFYGANNVQQGKVGDIIYIPAVSTLEEQTKFSGPGPLRDLLTDIFKKLGTSSKTFAQLKNAFDEFSRNVKTDETDDGKSLSKLEEDLNADLSAWDASIRFDVNPIEEAQIIKNLISFTITENQLDCDLPAAQTGDGFQRNLIYSVIRITARYKTPVKKSKKKEFSPDLVMLLFEEPESFLHPPQQRLLWRSLKDIASNEGRQVIATSHSPYFVSLNADDLPSLGRVYREAGKTLIGQIGHDTLNTIWEDNQKINEILEGTNEAAEPLDWRSDMEAVKYFLWLDPDRCGMFFSEHVLLVEGCTEKVVLDYLVNKGEIDTPQGGVFVLDCLGKYNVHRFMNILGHFQILHSVLIDLDEGKEIHEKILGLIEGSSNKFTVKIDSFPEDIESFLGVDKPKRSHRKPQHLMLKIIDGTVARSKIGDLKKKTEALFPVLGDG